MSKFLYMLYAVVLLFGSTVVNIRAANLNSSTSSGWNSHGGGTSWGGAGSSTGGFFSGGGHK
jgi:hypothetical protein